MCTVFGLSTVKLCDRHDEAGFYLTVAFWVTLSTVLAACQWRYCWFQCDMVEICTSLGSVQCVTHLQQCEI